MDNSIAIKKAIVTENETQFNQMESISHQIYLLINLSNSSNKQSFENLLTNWLLSAGHNVIQHTDNADWILVDRVSKLENRDNVFVHADDTGILVTTRSD